MMNKIGLTLLLVWLAVRAIAADYSYERNVVWILLTSRMYKTHRSWFGFMAAV